ncbi:hypothetical protein [Enterococcus faecalis]|uniref:hypothetical protein n=1 Tax=Enterococcus faecalis TaxID=1351 RepID=UPI000459F0DE|nr:hypothetical protein [Enterococcus faecalis]KAJ86936.1 transposase [Enterococcus faecalis NY9]
MTDIQPNYAALAKQYNCDYRTVKRYYEAGKKGNSEQIKKRKSSVSPLLDGFEEMIKNKLELSYSASSIYYFIKKKRYKDGYTTVKRFCRNYREKRGKKATIRLETIPVLSAQVDWKECPLQN